MLVETIGKANNVKIMHKSLVKYISDPTTSPLRGPAIHFTTFWYHMKNNKAYTLRRFGYHMKNNKKKQVKQIYVTQHRQNVIISIC